MFKELYELAKQGGVVLSITTEGELLRVIIMPEGGANPALSTPLSLVASPDELDTEFSTLIKSFTAKRTSLKESLEASLLVMDAAEKEAVKKPIEAPVKAATTVKEVVEDKPAEEISLF